MAKASGEIYVKFEVQGVARLNRALKAIGEVQAPEIKSAVEQIARMMDHEAGIRAPGSIGAAVHFVGVKGETVTRIKGTIAVKHPGAKAMEFGRRYYYRGYTGRNVKSTGHRFRAERGQQARPYIGVKDHNAAVGVVAPTAKRLISEAIEATWARVAGGLD